MLAMHRRALRYAANTAKPTMAGSFISGQNITGSSGTWDLAYVETRSRFMVASPPFNDADYSLLATTSAIALTGSEIGKRLKYGVSVRTLDGWSPYVYSDPSAIVQDAPSLPLGISGSAPATAYTNSPYTFTVTALNGTPAGASPKYTFALIGTWPTGATITPNAAGDQATITGPFTIAGNFGGLSVRVTDSLGATADLPTFALNVISSGNLIKITPGTGWPGATPGEGTNNGSAANVGYGHSPNIRWAQPQFDELTGQTILEAIILHTGPKSDWDSVQNPTWGINTAKFGVDGGAFVEIPASYNPATNRWSYRFIIDAADFPDRVYNSSGTLNEVRAEIKPKNGLTVIAQGDPQSMGSVGYRFVTNKNGGITKPVYYVAVSGNDTTGNGSIGNPYASISKAHAVIAAANGNSVGGSRIILRGGNHALSWAATTYADNGRWATIEAYPGETVTLNSVPGSSSNYRVPMLRLKNLRETSSNMIGLNTNFKLWCDGVDFDRNGNGAQDWVWVGDLAPFNSAAPNTQVYVTGGSITNWPNGPQACRLVKDHATIRIANNAYTNSLCVLNSTVDTILAGVIETSPGVDMAPPNNTFHPDVIQQFRDPNQTGKNYWWGAIYYNVSGTTGRVNSQIIFYDDMPQGWLRNMMLVNFNFVMDTSKSLRNALYLLDTETLVNSMFYDVTLNGGNRAFKGMTDDVVAVRLRLSNMTGGANSVPGQILNYAA